MDNKSENPKRNRWVIPALRGAAIIYALATLSYSVLWMFDARAGTNPPRVELGFGNDFVSSEKVYLISDVYLGSPAERAGLTAGDKILTIEGHKIDRAEYLDSVWRIHNPGDTIHLGIIRKGVKEMFPLTAIFRFRQSVKEEGGLQQIVSEVNNSYPVPFVVVGLLVLLLRSEDQNAWLLSLLFGCFIASGGISNNFEVLPALRPFAMGYRSVFSSLLGPIFYFFFAVFPVQSSIDRRVPWLKWLAMIMGLSFAIHGFRQGSVTVPPPFYSLVGNRLSMDITFVVEILFTSLGLTTLTLNFVRAHDAEVRRKIRIILWGSAVGVMPIFIEVAAEHFISFHASSVLVTTLILLLFLFPLSFAYAVVRHRVLDIPVLLKRSARYLLVQRGFTFLLSLLSISLVLLFAVSLSGYLHLIIPLTQPAEIALGAAFGTVLLWGGTQVHRRVSNRIDRAFFRHAYDARQILEDLAEKSALTRDRRELAMLLSRNLMEALQPQTLVIYLRSADGILNCVSGETPTDLHSISSNLPLLVGLTAKGEPVDYQTALKDQDNPLLLFAPLEPECLVPMVARGKRLTGLLVVGMRRSEELYSGEDKRLLTSVATQAAAALENIRLAEEISERKENEQRVVREMEISRRLLEADNARKTQELEEARQLQLSMLPVSLPTIPGLDIAVLMKTATEVGGDYYDFSSSHEGSLTVALGDATGHGLKAGTMVVAAKSSFNSYSHLSDLLEILEKMTSNLKKLNMRSLYMSMVLLRIKSRTAYVASAGMPCPLVYRAAGAQVDEVQLKGMPLGAFSDFPYEERTVDLLSGDTIVLMSDGLPEMFNNHEEMLGSDRIKDLLKRIGQSAPKEIIQSLAELGESWAGGKPQQDDVTLVVVKVL
jgi:serine phosphatase RsbU (regulator of sigma subunit)